MNRPAVRNLRALACGLALTAVAVWAPRVAAYRSYNEGGVGCVQCHGFYGADELHTNHLSKFGIIDTGACDLCHRNVGGGDGSEVLTYWSGAGFGCAGCHGNDYGETSPNSLLPKATGYGLRRHHEAKGVPGCPGCHVAGALGHPNPLPPILPETSAPPYYGMPSNNLTDPCSSAQEDFDGNVGLDNDGNGLADLADSACGAFPSTTTTVAPSTTTTTLPGGGARFLRIYPGQSIQEAVDAAAPGAKILVMPGTYRETHGGTNAVTISKNGIRLIARSKPKSGLKVILEAAPGQRNGIVVQPAVSNTRINGSRIRGFTVQGFPNNGIMTRYVDNFRIERNESIDNLENGIWPTLSANGLVRNNIAYGSQDSALWVEASENVRVIKNEFYNSPTGLEITVSKNVLVKKNNVHDNTVGIGLYHPNGASLPPLGGDGDWQIIDNWVHDNNYENTAPPGSMPAALPIGTGILVLGVDNVLVERNLVENNGFLGIGVADWCVAGALAGPGTSLDCTVRAPIVDSVPNDNLIIGNELVSNSGAPPAGFELFAADLVYLAAPNTGTCFSGNTPGATTFPPMLPECS